MANKMKILQLFREGNEILGTDGIMYVDGRLNLSNMKAEIVKRNFRFKQNFPHKVADQFSIYNFGIGSKLGTKFNVPR